MVPTPNTNVAIQAAATFTSMFKSRRVVGGLMAAFANRIQELETAIWSVIRGRMLSGGVGGVTLDVTGQLVGEARKGRTDADYSEAVGLRILIDRCNGLEPEILAIVDKAAGGSPWEFWDSPPANFTVLFGGSIPALRALASAVGASRPGGVSAHVEHTAGPFSGLLRPGSATGAGDTLAANGPGSTVGATPLSVFTHVQGV